MTDDKQTPAAPTGLTRRRRRLSDAETARRMLDAGLAMLQRTGLTVSLEHLRFEDVIREAGVARSAVYRRWPYKDLFFSDLLRELATSAPAVLDAAGEPGEDAVRRYVLDHADRLATAEGRHELFVEALRLGAQRDFQIMCSSAQWRTYMALHATFLSLEDSELRAEIGTALGRAEADLARRIAASYKRLAAIFGLRPRADSCADFAELALRVSASMRGFVISALSLPELAEPVDQEGAFGTKGPAPWSAPARAITATVLASLEPDPDVAWNEKRLEQARNELHA